MEKLLEFKNISKSFPGVKALEDVSIDLFPGEVHIIVGENGAGKSTLMKILSGAYTADEGQLLLQGTPILKNSPRLSEQLGIAMIYQELNLISELSVASNIFLGHEILKGCFLDMKEMERQTEELLKSVGISVSPSALMKNLSVANQQMVEITKALSRNARIIVFDEPTSSLTASEIRELFRIIARLKEKGVGMFYISHRLEELFEIGDRVTIMRDGRKIATRDIVDIGMNELVEGIAGRRIDAIYPRSQKQIGDVLLEIKNLSGDIFSDISISVRAGEIVGIAGLVGSGRSEVAKAAFGIDSYESGEVLIEQKPIPKNDPQKAVSMGLALLPENRKLEGLALSLGIKENSVISALGLLNPMGVVEREKEAKVVSEFVRDLEIATPTIEKLTKFLSGGTQQKVVIAKWLLTRSKVFIFDEPTRGIDIGSKSGIYYLMEELVERGAGIIMISSELPEILGMSDRIYVMAQGRIAGELDGKEADQKKILQMAFSGAKSKDREGVEA